MTNNSNNKQLTKTAAFRIADAQYEQFLDLLKSIPGADAGTLYREIFTRGLRAERLLQQEGDHQKTDGSEEERGA